MKNELIVFVKSSSVGIGNTCKKVVNPTKIASLDGIPIAFIACGGYHSFAVSKSGAVFGWGKNALGFFHLFYLFLSTAQNVQF